MTKQDPNSGTAETSQARAELYDTLGQLRDRLNYAQRVDNAVDRAKARIAAQKREEPAKFLALVTVVASGAGLAAWGIARAVARRFE